MLDREIYITDLIDAAMLQKIQDSFTKVTGLASLTTDADGKPVTEGSGFTEYCMKYTRGCEKGRERCEQCDKFGAESTLRSGKSTTYQCHSGLVDFSAPIVVEGQLVGCFIGGQVLTEPPNEKLVRAVAADLSIDGDEFWQAALKVPVMDRKNVDADAQYLFELASILSDIAYGKYLAIQAKDEIEKAANMKTDFLANMSHEIRTPMNAVIGMAEMALREEISPEAREYISQIKSSGAALLNIINDILDFSKIESGKMDICEEEYEPLALFNDVVNIVMTRLKDKNVELLLAVNPRLPSVLYGDNLRIRQILINIANNAVKFTERGKVLLMVDFQKLDDENIKLRIAVKDTGIGIKEKDLDVLFESFQQVDSKRNRNVEGTGLGLAITQRLLGLMGGDIKVSSIYEKGSTFEFQLPQKVIDWKHAITVEEADKKAAIGYWSNVALAKQFYEDVARLNVLSAALPTVDRYEEVISYYGDLMEGRQKYIFMDESDYDDTVEELLDLHPDLKCVLVTDFYSTRKSEKKNIIVARKPLSTVLVAMALSGKAVHSSSGNDAFEFDFIAPKAEVLIVDDNEVNLTVAEGLLKPLRMNISTANSGKKALELIKEKKFDIIFMDHMMPELDGVETTRIIRRLHPSYDKVPIIALTANAISGVKEKFMAEGMNDYVAKPVELRSLIQVIKQWLPEDKIVKGVFSGGDGTAESVSQIEIGDLDVTTALRYIGDESLYWNILRQYYRAIPAKSVKIKELQNNGDIPAYTIEVHALKSTSKQIGAMELSDMAAKLEAAGDANDTQYIDNHTDIMLQRYVEYIDVLKPYCKEEESHEERCAVDKNSLDKEFTTMLEAIEELDIDKMEQVILDMDSFEYPSEQKKLFVELKNAVGNIDVDMCTEIIEKWKKLI